jgi:predicted RNA-binding Zn-ribbon protein involved in translation (DUF1610 family)
MVRWEFTESQADFDYSEDYYDDDEDDRELYYSSASIQVFCEGESCGLVGKTIDFDDLGATNGLGLTYGELEERINTEVQKIQIGGKYLCEICRGVNRLVSRDEQDYSNEIEANSLHESYCEKCGNEIEVRRSMGNHTQYQCEVCGYNSSLDSEGGWEAEESPESQRYGEVTICLVCNNEFISEEIGISGKCQTCEEQKYEDWEDEMEDEW